MAECNMKRWISVVAVALMAAGPLSQATAQDDDLSMRELLQEVKEGRSKARAENREREQAFLADKAEQDRLIREAEQRIATLEKQSAGLEKRFNANELKVEEKRAQRDQRLGSLKELFGHLTGAAGDLRVRLRNSITSSQFDGRQAFLDQLIKKMNDDTDLPTVDEIEGLWYELHREMTESSAVAKYQTKVVQPGLRWRLPVLG